MSKETGILMPLFSLPSETGIGELGEVCEKWLSILAAEHISVWQILPLNPVGYGNSPYQPYSSFAGDEIYLSLEQLQKQGLLSENPVMEQQNRNRVEYDKVRNWKEKYFRRAFATFLEKNLQLQTEYQQFCEQKWLKDYSIFRSFKKKNDNACWIDWKESDRDWPLEHTELSKEVQEEAAYQRFLQYEFYVQWMAVKNIATQKNIRILGDVPFYVGLDSSDVWADRENFLLEKDGTPQFIAGVPPDYFSATGQRWGNPIYDWEHLQKTGFEFWVQRIGYSAQLFDMVRIDHFRAFDTYWKIPASCPTAVEGEWVEAPGYKVIDVLKKKIPNLFLVAEDLGDLRKEVLTLRDYYGLPGMKIIQFCFHFEKKQAYDYFNDHENLIVYSGTHDNDTLIQWYQGLRESDRRKLRKYLKHQGLGTGTVREQLIRYVLKSQAWLAVLSLTDVLGIGPEGHINYPGTVGSPNWEWRLSSLKEAAQGLSRLPIR